MAAVQISCFLASPVYSLLPISQFLLVDTKSLWVSLQEFGIQITDITRIYVAVILCSLL